MKIRKSPCRTCEKESCCTNKKCIYFQDWVYEAWPQIKELFNQAEKENTALPVGADKAENQGTINNYSINEKKGESQDV